MRRSTRATRAPQRYTPAESDFHDDYSDSDESEDGDEEDLNEDDCESGDESFITHGSESEDGSYSPSSSSTETELAPEDMEMAIRLMETVRGALAGVCPDRARKIVMHACSVLVDDFGTEASESAESGSNSSNSLDGRLLSAIDSIALA